MTHDELLLEISSEYPHNKAIQALYEVVELHKPTEYGDCSHCFGLHSMGETYPCPTIQAIEKEMQ